MYPSIPIILNLEWRTLVRGSLVFFSADAAFHFELHETGELDGGFERNFLDDRIEKPVDEQSFSIGFFDATALQIEEFLGGDLLDGGLVLNLG